MAEAPQLGSDWIGTGIHYGSKTRKLNLNLYLQEFNLE